MSISGKARDKHSGTKAWIVAHCRKLRPEHVDWDRASDPDRKYNCMGYACGPVNGNLRWWQSPYCDEHGVCLNQYDYWPFGSTKDDIDNFVEAAKTAGFLLCDEGDEGFKTGSVTIAIYYQNNQDKDFKHASICLPSGKHRSKMAHLSDFEHELTSFDDVSSWIPLKRKFMRKNNET